MLKAACSAFELYCFQALDARLTSVHETISKAEDHTWRSWCKRRVRSISHLLTTELIVEMYVKGVLSMHQDVYLLLSTKVEEAKENQHL